MYRPCPITKSTLLLAYCKVLWYLSIELGRSTSELIASSTFARNCFWASKRLPRTENTAPSLRLRSEDSPHVSSYKVVDSRDSRSEKNPGSFFEPDLVYYRMRYYTFPRVFPHAGIHTSECISTCGNPRKNVYSRTFFPAEIHESACKLTCGNSLSRSNFPSWKYTKK